MKLNTISFFKNVATSILLLTISQTITAQSTGETVTCTFDTPRDSALPNLFYRSYNTDPNFTGSISVIGENGPDLSPYRKLDFAYANGELSTFFFQRQGGDFGQVNLVPNTVYAFDQVNPELTLSNTGIPNFDGSYYVSIMENEAGRDFQDFIMVSKTGAFTIYFSYSDSPPDCVVSDDTTTLSVTNNKIENGAVLKRNYPNPFESTTTIEYSLSKKSNVNIEIYNLQGQLVKSLNNGVQSSGNHKLTFDLDKMSNGTYITVLVTDQGSKKQLLVLKN